MQSVKFLFHQNGTPKLTLPPLIVDNEQGIKSMCWLSRRSSTPPAFLEPQPLTTMDQHRDVIQLPRSHRLSLSSLSSISTESSSEEESAWTHGDAKTDKGNTCTEQQQGDQQNNNQLPLPSINTSLIGINSKDDNNNDASRQSQSLPTFDKCSAKVNDYVTRVDSAGRHLHIGSLSPPHADGNHVQTPPPLLQQTSSSPTNSSSGSDSSSPSSPVPSSLSTFWASPSTNIQNEQRHDFVTKNAHIKRPRNAWIHFRCYFGQALKAKDPTIRAEEISKRASEYWSRLTNKQKKPWHVMAEQEKLAHQEAFPDYRYRPKRALPKSLVLAYPSTGSTCDLDPCKKKFRLA